MPETVYDRNAGFYVDFVDRGLAAGNYEEGLSRFASLLGSRLAGARVCDLCCGEGHVGRWLAAHDVREVVGIDSSAALIEAARARADSDKLS